MDIMARSLGSPRTEPLIQDISYSKHSFGGFPGVHSNTTCLKTAALSQLSPRAGSQLLLSSALLPLNSHALLFSQIPQHLFIWESVVSWTEARE